MGDVSDYSASEANSASADMAAIMNGGANWMARMDALVKAQERAQALIAESGMVGEISALRDEAKNIRDAAAKDLDDAKNFADGIVSKANAQADEIVAKAKAAADAVVAQSKADAEKVANDASAMMQAAQMASVEADKKLSDASAALDRAKARQAEIDASADAIKKQADDLAAAQAQADEIKARYLSLTGRLKEVMDAEFGPVPAPAAKKGKK